MPIAVKCPKCGRPARAPDNFAGRSAKCPGCGNAILVPGVRPAAQVTPQSAVEETAVRPCPLCGRQLKLARKLHGRQVQCGGCHSPLIVSAAPWGLTAAGPAPAVAPRRPSPQQADFDDPLGLGALDLGQSEITPTTTATKRSRTKKHKFNMPLILAIGGGVLGVLVLVIVIFMMLSGGGAPKSAMRYMPDNSKLVMSIDVAGLLGSKLYKDVALRIGEPMKELEQSMSAETGLTLADLSRVTLGGDMASKNEAIVAVIELSRDLDQDKLFKSAAGGKWTEEKIENAVMHIRSVNPAVYFPDKRTVVMGTPDALRSVLKRSGAPAFSDSVRGAVAQLDQTQTIALATGPGDLPLNNAPVPAQAELLKKIRAFTLHANVGADMRLAATVGCTDSGAAEQLQKISDGFLAASKMGQMPPDTKMVIESLKISRSGSKLTATMTANAELLITLVLPAIQASRDAAQRAKALNEQRLEELNRPTNPAAPSVPTPRPRLPRKTKAGS